jgi:hypothetical protein
VVLVVADALGEEVGDAPVGGGDEGCLCEELALDLLPEQRAAGGFCACRLVARSICASIEGSQNWVRFVDSSGEDGTNASQPSSGGMKPAADG